MQNLLELTGVQCFASIRTPILRWANLMFTRLVFFIFALVFCQHSFASNEKPLPLFIWGEELKYCAKYGEPVHSELLRGIDAAAISLQNLIPYSIWNEYRNLTAQDTVQIKPSILDLEYCSTFSKKLLSVNVASILRGEAFIHMIDLFGSLTDCIIDNDDMGKLLLEDVKKFYIRNNIVFPAELITILVVINREASKIRNGWDTKSCTNLQNAINSNELVSVLSDAKMRSEITFGKY